MGLIREYRLQLCPARVEVRHADASETITWGVPDRDAGAEGCDVSHVVKDEDRLTALVLLGLKDRETFPLVFYRENCAHTALDPSDFDEAFIARAKRS